MDSEQEILKKNSSSYIPFLRENQFSIIFSHRCNYCCSYCCSSSGRNSPKSWIEENPQQVARLLYQLDPGVILVSGGEPMLWRDLPYIIQSTSKHIWIVLTNASIVPKWLRPELVPMMLAAFHCEDGVWTKFIENIKEIQNRGIRVMVKLIVIPNREQETFDQWKEAREHGIIAHLCPIEFDVHYPQKSLENIVDHFITSCLYNSRFFSLPLNRKIYCPAGSSKMFHVDPEGNIVVCSHDQKPTSHISKGLPTVKAVVCDSTRCYCEWHHWSGYASNHENERWNDFYYSGEWKIPTKEEFKDYLLKANYSLHGMNIEESKVPLL